MTFLRRLALVLVQKRLFLRLFLYDASYCSIKPLRFASSFFCSIDHWCIRRFLAIICVWK